MFPSNAKTWCSNKKTLASISGLSLLSILLNVPSFFVCTWDDNGKVDLTEFGLSNSYQGYEIWGSFIMRYLLPVLVLITLSTAVTIKVIYNENNNAQVENI